MKAKRIGKALLYPPLAVMIPLLPISIAAVVCSMLLIGEDTVPAYISYALATYTLTVWCLRIPRLIRGVKRIRRENRLVVRWFEDERLRFGITLLATFLWNAGYAALQFGLGATHRSFWFYSLGGYYLSLAVMRFFLMNYLRRYEPGEKLARELHIYRACGWIFLVMNLAISLIIFFMVYWDRTFSHHEITTIALAAYTFMSFIFAIRNALKYRKSASPVLSASKAISLAAAGVSMLTLESTMLTTFGGDDMSVGNRRLMLGISGGAIAAFIVAMAVIMIVNSSKQLKKLKGEKDNG